MTTPAFQPGAFTYTPNPDVTGMDTVTCTASDGTVSSNVGTLTVRLEAAGFEAKLSPPPHRGGIDRSNPMVSLEFHPDVGQ